jgi:hypothetical protein
MHQLFKIIAVIFLFPVMAFAMDFGGDVSGGGYVIVCKDPATGVETTELLDYFEARYTMKKYKVIDLSKVDGKTVFDKARSVVQMRLDTWSPQLSQKISDTITNFEVDEMNFIKRGVITDIDDAQTSIDPDANCFKSQIAVQFKTPAPNQYRVLVDSKAWDKLNDQTKIGLLIHEALYTLALEQGHTNSNKVRAISAVLAMENFESYVEKGHLPKLFQFSNIEGCMQMVIFFNKTSEDKFEMKLPVNISSYENVYGVRKAKLCRDYHYAEFLGDSYLSLQTNSEVEVREDTRDFHGPSVEFKSSNWSHFTGSLRFSLLPPFYLISATSSYLPVQPTSESVILDSCEDRVYIDGKFEKCWSVKGTFKFLGKDFEIQTFTERSKELQFLDLKENIGKISLLGETLSFGETVAFFDRKISLSYYGPNRKFVFKGQEVEIEMYTRFIFNELGELLSIRSPHEVIVHE